MDSLAVIPQGGEALDRITDAAEATRPQEPGTLFSPRSSAAHTLSSISLQQTEPQQIIFGGENGPNFQPPVSEVDENTTPASKDDLMMKDDFCPPKEPKSLPISLQTQKTRRVSDGPNHGVVDQNAPLQHDRPSSAQRSTSVATPGVSANKLSFGSIHGETRASFHPPPSYPDGHHNGHPNFFPMLPSAPHHTTSPSNAENFPTPPNGNENTPENAPYPHHEPQKYSPLNQPHPHHHQRSHPHAQQYHPHPHHPHQPYHQKFTFPKTSPATVNNKQPQQPSHSVDFQPPAWKSHPNKESRQHSRLVPAPNHRPYRSMAVPQPVISSWPEPVGWDQPLPNGTPFIMHQGQLYPYYPHHHPQMMVTPTPQKKQRVEGKSAGRLMSSVGRSSSSSFPKPKKSLGVLAIGFMDIFEKEKGKRTHDELEEGKKPLLSGDPSEIVIDHVAIDLEVERRRIYDVVNILEALRIVVKKGKNTYEWMGREHLARQFALMQKEGIDTWPEHAITHGIISESDVEETSDEQAREESKSLTRLSQLFLHVFLVGFDNVNLPQVSDLIHGRKSSKHDLAKLGSNGQEPPKDPNEFTKAATRGLKTKIRRLYDVANVFLAVGLLRKTENRIAATVDAKRPHYHWNFAEDATGIKRIYESMEQRMKDSQTPFFASIDEANAAKAKSAACQTKIIRDTKTPALSATGTEDKAQEKAPIAVKQEENEKEPSLTMENVAPESKEKKSTEPVQGESVSVQCPSSITMENVAPENKEKESTEPVQGESVSVQCPSSTGKAADAQLLDEVNKGTQNLMSSFDI